MLVLAFRGYNLDAQSGKFLPHVPAAKVGVDHVQVCQGYICSGLVEAFCQMDAIFALSASVSADDHINRVFHISNNSLNSLKFCTKASARALIWGCCSRLSGS